MDTRSPLTVRTVILPLFALVLAAWAIASRDGGYSRSSPRVPTPAPSDLMTAEAAVDLPLSAEGSRSLVAPVCAGTSHAYTETVISTRAERLAHWDEEWQRNQAWLASLNPNDARRETEVLLAQRATIVAGPDTVTQQIPFTEISEVCPSTSPAPPGTNGPTPEASPPRVVSPGSSASMSMSPPAGLTNPLPIGSPGPPTGAT